MAIPAKRIVIGEEERRNERGVVLERLRDLVESAPTMWCLRSESNQRHADFQSAALPTELQRHILGFTKPESTRFSGFVSSGDPERARTVDLQRDRLAF